MRKLLLIFCLGVLMGCATTSQVEEKPDIEALELQTLMSAEILASQNDIDSASTLYYQEAMRTSNQDIFSRAFIYNSIAKKYDKAEEIVLRWRTYYETRDSLEALVVSELFLDKYPDALANMDFYASTYKSGIYELLLNFIPSISEEKRIWLYGELKARQQKGMPHLAQVLLAVGIEQVNTLVKSEKLDEARLETDFLLSIVESDKKNKFYTARKSVLLDVYLELDLEIEFDLDAKKYKEYLAYQKGLDTFYFKLARYLALFLDKEKLAMIDTILDNIAKNATITPDTLGQHIEVMEFARGLGLRSPLNIYASADGETDVEIYARNLAKFYLPSSNISIKELGSMDKDLVGEVLVVEYYISKKDFTAADKQFESLVASRNDIANILVIEYLQLLQKYDQDQKVIEISTSYIDTLDGWSEYAEYLYFMRAISYSRLSMRESMIEDFSTMLDEDDESVIALNGLGYSLIENEPSSDDIARAEDLLAEAMALEPLNPGVIDSVGWLFLRQGKSQEAVKMLRSAYRVVDDSEIVYHLAMGYFSVGDKEKSYKLARKIWMLEPDYKHLDKLLETMGISKKDFEGKNE